MTAIKQLRDSDTGGFCNEDIYPVTSTSAVCSKDSDGNDIEGVENCLEQRLEDIEAGITKLNDIVRQLADAIKAISESDIIALFSTDMENT